MTIHAALALPLLGLGSCAPPLPATGLHDRQASLAARPWIDSAGLAKGRRLFQARCAACHGLPDPREYSPEAWPALVADMAPRSGLDTAGSRMLLDWILLGDAPNRAPAASVTEVLP